MPQLSARPRDIRSVTRRAVESNILLLLAQGVHRRPCSTAQPCKGLGPSQLPAAVCLVCVESKPISTAPERRPLKEPVAPTGKESKENTDTGASQRLLGRGTGRWRVVQPSRGLLRADPLKLTPASIYPVDPLHAPSKILQGGQCLL